MAQTGERAAYQLDQILSVDHEQHTEPQVFEG